MEEPNKGFDWIGIAAIFLCVASARAQLVLWLWGYELPYMKQVPPTGYMVAAPVLAVGALLVALGHKPTKGGKILQVICGVVLCLAVVTVMARYSALAAMEH